MRVDPAVTLRENAGLAGDFGVSVDVKVQDDAAYPNRFTFTVTVEVRAAA